MKNLNFQIVIILAALFVLFLSNCNSDDMQNDINKSLCEMPRDTTYVLSDTIKEYIVNYLNAEKVIFKTGNDDVVFDVSRKEESLFITSLTSEKCTIDTSFEQPFNINTQLLNFSLSNSEFSKPIVVSLAELRKNFPFGPYEFVVVTEDEYDLIDSEVLFYYRVNNQNEKINYYDSLDIGGKMFYSVFELNEMASPTKIDIKYTKNEGIIYIKNKENGKEYIYDRVE